MVISNSYVKLPEGIHAETGSRSPWRTAARVAAAKEEGTPPQGLDPEMGGNSPSSTGTLMVLTFIEQI